MANDHISKELRERIEQQARERLANTPSGRYRRELDTHVPIGGKGNEDKLAFFWIGYVVLFLIVAPVLINLL